MGLGGPGFYHRRVFTGIIERVGRIRTFARSGAGARLVVEAGPWRYRANKGDSVAVSGVCLTAVQNAGRANTLIFDAVPETLARTTLGELAPGDNVNLEHAATAGTLLGGHMVQAHVDGVAEVVKVETRGEWRVRLRPPAGLMRYMIHKGSVCLDGVSLTLAAVGASWIEVALIPVTLEKTTLGEWRAGRRVNIEADIISKTIVTHLEHRTAVLRRAGRKP